MLFSSFTSLLFVVSLKEIFLARHEIFLGNQMYKKIGASRVTNC